MHSVPLPVNVPYVAKFSAQWLTERMEPLEQWLESHPRIATLLTALIAALGASFVLPILVAQKLEGIRQ
jgi:hypothetical protein